MSNASVFTMLPIETGNASLVTVAHADMVFATGYDPGSYEHWIFDKGDSSGLVGLNQGIALTVQSTAPTYSANYLTMLNTSGKGLVSDFPDSAGPVTICAVVQDVSSTNVVKIPFGTLTGSGASGAAVFFAGAEPTRTAYVRADAATTNANTGKTIVHDTWRFVAFSRDYSGATKRAAVLVGGQTVFQTTTGTGAYIPSANNIALGNGYYTASGASTNMHFAEFIIFGHELTPADLADVYTQSKARMSDRGITVV